VVIVYSQIRKYQKFEKIVKKAALFVLKEKKQKGGIEIFLVENNLIKKLNKKFRKKNKVTNVLSLSWKGILRPDLKTKNFLGEIYLAPDFIFSHHEEIEFLTIHGVLHLLGYTHSNQKSSIIMKREENKIWSKFRKIKCQK
jgi:probable rRNA maturation factor